jgi:hypothetical protein
VKRIAKLLIVIVAMAALPLRGTAALAMAFCDSHHSMPAAAQATDHGGSHEHAQGDNAPMHEHGDGAPLASACSLCSACCVNATAAAESSQALAFAPQRAARIPFFDAPFQGVFHKLPVPPPLAPAR